MISIYAPYQGSNSSYQKQTDKEATSRKKTDKKATSLIKKKSINPFHKKGKNLQSKNITGKNSNK